MPNNLSHVIVMEQLNGTILIMEHQVLTFNRKQVISAQTFLVMAVGQCLAMKNINYSYLTAQRKNLCWYACYLFRNMRLEILIL